VISFEPLEKPASTFRRVFKRDDLVVLHEAAIGPSDELGTMHLSRRDDSSSLLAITPLQDTIFPGTEEVGTVRVRVAPLAVFLDEDDIREPALLKIDVQGYELEVLRGCEPLLARFDRVYCECSFVELYKGQGLAGAVIEWLAERGYTLTGVYNAAYDGDGRAVQADFLFARCDADCAAPA
jgi:FkbM family methyltransferase